MFGSVAVLVLGSVAVGGREMCRDGLVDGTASIVMVLVGGTVLVVLSVFPSMVMMIIR